VGSLPKKPPQLAIKVETQFVRAERERDKKRGYATTKEE
jgi:hypothetical protein